MRYSSARLWLLAKGMIDTTACCVTEQDCLESRGICLEQAYGVSLFSLTGVCQVRYFEVYVSVSVRCDIIFFYFNI